MKECPYCKKETLKIPKGLNNKVICPSCKKESQISFILEGRMVGIVIILVGILLAFLKEYEISLGLSLGVSIFFAIGLLLSKANPISKIKTKENEKS